MEGVIDLWMQRLNSWLFFLINVNIINMNSNLIKCLIWRSIYFSYQHYWFLPEKNITILHNLINARRVFSFSIAPYDIYNYLYFYVTMITEQPVSFFKVNIINLKSRICSWFWTICFHKSIHIIKLDIIPRYIHLVGSEENHCGSPSCFTEFHHVTSYFGVIKLSSYFGELFNLLLGQNPQYDIPYLYFLIFCSACRPKESGSLLNLVFICIFHKISQGMKTTIKLT